MNGNKNTAGDLTAMVFSFLSLKVKLIIIGVILVVFLIMLLPVIILAGIGGVGEDDEESTNTTTTSSVVVTSDNMYQYVNGQFPMPFETWDSSRDVITSRFSKSRTITVNGVTQTKAHTGMDLVCVSKSSPQICAVKEGKVVVATPGTTGYGNYVVIEHHTEDKTFYTLYGHMKAGSIMVAVGDEISQGQVLGTMGSTGNSTGPHLHFEVRLDNNSSSSAVDPYPYLFGEE